MHSTSLQLLIVSLLVLSVAACQLGNSVNSVQDDQPTELPAAPYRLQTGDQLRVEVKTAPELSRTLILLQDGRTEVPYSGPILVHGLTLIEVERAFEEALSSELIDPDVDVILLKPCACQEGN